MLSFAIPTVSVQIPQQTSPVAPINRACLLTQSHQKLQAYCPQGWIWTTLGKCLKFSLLPSLSLHSFFAPLSPCSTSDQSNFFKTNVFHPFLPTQKRNLKGCTTSSIMGCYDAELSLHMQN